MQKRPIAAVPSLVIPRIEKNIASFSHDILLRLC